MSGPVLGDVVYWALLLLQLLLVTGLVRARVLLAAGAIWGQQRNELGVGGGAGVGVGGRLGGAPAGDSEGGGPRRLSARWAAAAAAKVGGKS